MGAYHLTKNFEIFERGTNGTEISWEKFQKIRKLLKIQKANHSTEISRMKVKWNGNFPEKNFENLGIPHEVVLFSGKLCQSLNISKANKSSGESAIFNFCGQNCELNGLIVFHSGAVNRKNSVPFAHGNF